jgi:hypothetical protein
MIIFVVTKNFMGCSASLYSVAFLFGIKELQHQNRFNVVMALGKTHKVFCQRVKLVLIFY